MTTRKLEKPQWTPYLDFLTKAMKGKRVEIEVASLNIGDQIEAEWAPLVGLVYDHKSDIVEVALETLDHMIPKPSAIFVEEGEGGVSSLDVVDADGVGQIIKLREPLLLPPPGN
jgi:hypothetical protein